MNSSSTLQETKIKAVSETVHLQRILKNETRARDPYPKDITPLSAPACKLAPIGTSQKGESNPNYPSRLVICGETPQGASFHQDAINTEQADELVRGRRKLHSNGKVETSPIRSNERELANKPHCFLYVGLHQFTPLAQCSRAVDNGQHVGGSSPSGRMAQELFLPFQHTTPFPAPIIIL